jgi:hypothetical protein
MAKIEAKIEVGSATGYVYNLAEHGDLKKWLEEELPRAFFIHLRDYGKMTREELLASFTASNYHSQKLIESQLALQEFNAKSDAELEQIMVEEYKQECAAVQRHKMQEENGKQKIREFIGIITRLMEKADPRDPRFGLNILTFAKEQLEMTRFYDYDEPKKMTLGEYKEKKLEGIRNDMLYHSRGERAEEERMRAGKEFYEKWLEFLDANCVKKNVKLRQDI